MAGMGHGADGADGRCYLELLGQEGKEHADLHEEGACESIILLTGHCSAPEPSTSSAQRNRLRESVTSIIRHSPITRHSVW